MEDPIIKSIEKFRVHQNIKLIKGCLLNNSTFSFDEITISNIEEELKNFDSSKAVQESEIPIKIIKGNINIFSTFCIENLISQLKQLNFHLK